MRPNERMVHANDVDLCIETFGDPVDPAILLISGAAASMDWWPEEFCERLAVAAGYVIRYDHRDTGRSVSSPPGVPSYTGPDLVADAVGILDALGGAAAHVVGISMGGAIGQHLVVHDPDRVASLTLISTGPDAPAGPGQAELPRMTQRLQAIFAAPPPEPDWSDRAAVINYMVEGERPFWGSLAFDETNVRGIAGRVVDRTENIAASMTNHWLLSGGGPVRDQFGRITVNTLVIHGTDDPMFPFGHAEALAAEIPGARLIPLPGVGHQMPPQETWDIVVAAITEQTAAGEGCQTPHEG